MNTRSITINLPDLGALPHEYAAAVSQAISEYAIRNDAVSAAVLAGLLALLNGDTAAYIKAVSPRTLPVQPDTRPTVVISRKMQPF